jgi:hypothetical protein
LETLDELTVNELLEETSKNKESDINTKKYDSPNKTNKRCLTPFNKANTKRNVKHNLNKKEDNTINKLTFDLNCNKIPQPSKINSTK